MANIKKIEVLQDSMERIGPNEKFQGNVKVQIKNGNGLEEKIVYFRAEFTHKYNPSTGQFEPRVNPRTGQPWDYNTYKEYPGSVVTMETSHYRNELDKLLTQYFNKQLERAYLPNWPLE